MYVTKLGFDDAKASRALLPGGSSKRGVLRSRIGAYRFDTLEDLLAVCRRLRALCSAAPSTAYRGDKGEWHLILDETDTPPALLGFLSEFGHPEDASKLSIYMGEHGICIRRGDAAGVLGAL